MTLLLLLSIFLMAVCVLAAMRAGEFRSALKRAAPRLPGDGMKPVEEALIGSLLIAMAIGLVAIAFSFRAGMLAGVSP